MRSRDFVFSSSPAGLFAAQTKLTDSAGEPTERHAEADPPQLHRHPRLRPDAHGPVFHSCPLLPERLTRRFSERGRAPETHRRTRRRGAPGRRAPQTGPDHLYSHVPAALSPGAAYCIFHQLPAAELFLRLYAI